jgi:hypothetical protein
VHDPSQVGLVEVELPWGGDVEHLRKAIRNQFGLDIPHQRLSIHLPDLTRPPNEEGRYLIPCSEKPLAPNAGLEKYLAPLGQIPEEDAEEKEQQERSEEGQAREEAAEGDQEMTQAEEGEERKPESEGNPKPPKRAKKENPIPGHTYERALLVTFIRTDVLESHSNLSLDLISEIELSKENSYASLPRGMSHPLSRVMSRGSPFPLFNRLFPSLPLRSFSIAPTRNEKTERGRGGGGGSEVEGEGRKGKGGT